MRQVSPAMRKEQLQWLRDGGMLAGDLPLLASEELNGAESNLSVIQTHTESVCCVDDNHPEQPIETLN